MRGDLAPHRRWHDRRRIGEVRERREVGRPPERRGKRRRAPRGRCLLRGETFQIFLEVRCRRGLWDALMEEVQARLVPGGELDWIVGGLGVQEWARSLRVAKGLG